jgi:hypothetical protein
MKVTLTDAGATVEAEDLGPLLGLEAAEVPAKCGRAKSPASLRKAPMRMQGARG